MGTFHFAVCRSCYLGLVLAVLAGLPGCGEGVPKTYTVKGKVVFQGKGKISRLRGAYVQFQSVADPTLMAVGEIEDDYTFTLGTFYKKTKGLPGAVEGQHRARIAFPSEEDDESPGKGIVHPKYTSFEKSGLQYTVHAGENDITVKVGLN